MAGPGPHTAEDASTRELVIAIVRLLAMLLALALLVVPLLRELPLGPTGRTGLLAWLLVALALYWLSAGLGYQPLLLTQLLLFSAAAALLTTKVALVLVGVERLSILRRTARGLILLGAGIAALNLISMLIALIRRLSARSGGPPGSRPA